MFLNFVTISCSLYSSNNNVVIIEIKKRIGQNKKNLLTLFIKHVTKILELSKDLCTPLLISNNNTNIKIYIIPFSNKNSVVSGMLINMYLETFTLTCRTFFFPGSSTNKNQES